MSADFLIETDLANALGDGDLAARIVMRVSPRARRLSLRLDPADDCVVLVRPKRASHAAVVAFVASRIEWIRHHLDSLPPRIAFRDGATIPYRGRDCRLELRAGARGGVWREGDIIVVSGRAEHMTRRVKEWLKEEARRALAPMAHTFAAAIDAKVAHVSVRDTRSRWGSCSPDGRLSFSWRLILAPEAVLAYVAAHEVAHLRHLNHGRAFWRLLTTLVQDYAAKTGEEIDARLARQWLRRSGAALHRYG